MSQCPRTLLFDLMGTCLDWYTSINPSLSHHLSLPKSKASTLALQWRQCFFDEIHTRFQAGQPQEDIDVTHRRVLERLLTEHGIREVDEIGVDGCVQAWHSQVGMYDLPDPTGSIKICGLFVHRRQRGTMCGQHFLY